MKDYYGNLKSYLVKKFGEDSDQMKELESIKNDLVKVIRLYNHYKSFVKTSPGANVGFNLDESNKMTKSKFKEYIKEVIIETLSEGTIDIIATSSNEEETSVQQDPKIQQKSAVVKALKTAAPGQRIRATTNELNLTELEPNKNQKLKLANKELAFLAKKVRSLEKQLKSQGSDENAG